MSPVTSSDALMQEDAVFLLERDQQNSGTYVIELQDNDDSDPIVDGWMSIVAKSCATRTVVGESL